MSNNVNLRGNEWNESCRKSAKKYCIVMKK